MTRFCLALGTAVGAVLALASIASAAPTPDDAWSLPGHFAVPSIVFSPNGRYVALGGSLGPADDRCDQTRCPGRLHVWNLQTGQRVFANTRSFARVMSLVFTPDGRRLVSGHADGAVMVWNLEDFTIVRQFHCCTGTWVRALAVSPDGRSLAIGAQSGELLLWDLSGDLRRQSVVERLTRSWPAHNYGISSLTFDASGRYLISSADDQHIRRWDLQTGRNNEFQRSPGREKAHRGMVKTVVLLGDGTQALSGAYWEGGSYKDYHSVAPPDHVLRLWNVGTGVPIRSFPLTYGIRCCMQVLNDHLVAFLKATAWDERLVFQVFNLDTGQVEHEATPTMGESFDAMGMHPNATRFLIGIGGGQYLLWDLTSGKSVAQLLSVDEGWAVFASDGRADFSEGFRRWPCRHNLQQACLGGKDVSPTPGLLARLIEGR